MQNAVDDVKVAALELSNKLWNQFWPLAGKVFMANVTNSITQLQTNADKHDLLSQ